MAGELEEIMELVTAEQVKMISEAFGFAADHNPAGARSVFARTVLHESGHAVAAEIFGQGYDRFDLVPDEKFLARVRGVRFIGTYNGLIINAAGQIAEHLFDDDDCYDSLEDRYENWMLEEAGAPETDGQYFADSGGDLEAFLNAAELLTPWRSAILSQARDELTRLPR